jgi:hypothetical protein
MFPPEEVFEGNRGSPLEKRLTCESRLGLEIWKPCLRFTILATVRHSEVREDGFRRVRVRRPATSPMKSILLFLLTVALATIASAAEDLSAVPVEKLIDDLAQIDSQALGLHGTALAFGFSAEDKPPQFGGGVPGSRAPKTPPQMRELARRGPAVLTQLIGHLDDKRPTKLAISKDSTMWRYFSDEYDPKTRPNRQKPHPRENIEKHFDGGYPVKIGDVCYALIGQIVNRNLRPVHYQPTLGLVINSPIEAPALIKRVKKDWGGVGVAAHKASLIADAQSGDQVWDFGPALVRLRFYYPDDYKRLKVGNLKKRITEFESEEKKPH